MEQWTTIRQRVLVEGVSRRQILRETGMHWTTLEKILSHSTPPGYQLCQPRPKPKLGPFLPRIRQILDDDKAMPRKQRHTAKRIFERLRDEGYTGGYTQVKAAVREVKQRSREVFVPLTHRPGEAQVDFGHALAKVDGTLRKVVLFVLALPHSDAIFVQVFERICTEVFWEGHRRAFAWLGGVPWRITYDNESILVAKVLGGRERKLTRGFLELQSHYLFDEHFCRVRRPNEKGVVEGTVKYARLNFLVPVRYGHHPVVVKGYTDRVEVCFKEKMIASHRRLWGKEDVSFDPVHYLALLERKPGALDHARPLEAWELPECFAVLRRRLEAERDGEGTREYVRVLRLLETHPLRTLRRAVEKALRVVQTDVRAYAALLAAGGAR